jgi:hypothetical protein
MLARQGERKIEGRWYDSTSAFVAAINLISFSLQANFFAHKARKMTMKMLAILASFLLLAVTTSGFQVTRFGLSLPSTRYHGLSAYPLMMPDEPNPEQPRPSPPSPRRQPPLPTVDGQSGQLDVVSRLLKDRILLLGSDVNDEVANVLVAQLLYLANEDPDKDITLYINSPGGSVSAGLAIYDTMQFIPCDVQTVCFGMAASMGAFLLGAGTKGKRKSLPNARIMIHQPLGGAQGQAADIEIQ